MTDPDISGIPVAEVLSRWSLQELDAAHAYIGVGPEWMASHRRAQLASASATVRVVPKPVMVMRSLRVPEALWNAAKAKADERGENISDVLREALERYVKGKR